MRLLQDILYVVLLLMVIGIVLSVIGYIGYQIYTTGKEAVSETVNETEPLNGTIGYGETLQYENATLFNATLNTTLGITINASTTQEDYDIVAKLSPLFIFLNASMILAIIITITAVFMHSRRR